MNSEWSELNKRMQIKLKKKDTFNDAIEMLFTLRKELMNQILEFKRTLSKEEFCAIPFINRVNTNAFFKTLDYAY